MQGHIHKRVPADKSGKERTLWYVVVDTGIDAGGRRRQKWHGSFRTRRKAEIARTKLVDDLHTGSYVTPGRTTLAEWVRESWLPMAATRIKPTTLHSYERNLEIHVLPVLGAKQLQQLTPTMLNTLYASLASERTDRRGLSAKTISYIHTIVHKALADAVDADLVVRNVADRAKPPRPNRQASAGIQSWDAEELRAFLAHVEGSRLEAVWRLAAMTGMRRREVLGLRWQDVDLDAGRLSVRQALVAVAYSIVLSTPKSHNARVIDLDAETVAMLRAHRLRQAQEREEWGTDYREGDLVVAKENGEPIHPHTFSQSFKRIVERGGAANDPSA